MKKITTILAVAIAMAGTASAQSSTQQSMTPEQAEMMKKWEAYMTPGDIHKMLAKSNGEWNEDVTMWMDPAAPPQKSTSTATNTMIMGGRYQQSMHRGSFNGMPFEGMSLLGYDNAKKTFISTWIDNMGTGIMTMEGTYDPNTKTVTSKGHEVDPMTGKDMDVREVFTMVDDNTQIMSMYMTPAGGKEFKTMEIKFTRK
ncbi:MAG TPA: DUF1579 domain-containing protein [Chitinophagaceae bacterium]|nr:DUF1579 domain-containing protein [Chitinophagaceae bacterium]